MRITENEHEITKNKQEQTGKKQIKTKKVILTNQIQNKYNLNIKRKKRKMAPVDMPTSS